MNGGDLDSVEILLLAGGSVLGFVLMLLAASLLWNGIVSGSLLAVTWILIGGVLVWPVFTFHRDRLWDTEHLEQQLKEEKRTVIATFILAILTALAFQRGLPFDRILLLPLQVGGSALYAAALPYGELIGTTGSIWLMNVGQWTLEIIWLYLLGGIGEGAITQVARLINR
ncbi:MAG: hypothetical protein ABEI97_03610 [Candidatus Nanohaloarchaea archaeon]